MFRKLNMNSFTLNPPFIMNLEQTADGSLTLYIPELDEHYHSVKGALTESMHIFIEMGLRHVHQQKQQIIQGAQPQTTSLETKSSETTSCIRLFEVGFGTGLNAFLTLMEAEALQRPVHYVSIERYPLGEDVWGRLDYPALIGRGHAGEFEALHRAPWNEDVRITPWFTLHKIEGDFTQQSFSAETYDLVYFDAFAPEKQPAMWSQPIFDALHEALSSGGVLTTYCAKGVIRRMLQTAGFTVERLPGPPGGKREILRATKG